MSKLSSEDDEYPASELNVHSPNTRGWQSRRFCDYPQELGFQLEDGQAAITQIQILSHQSKISTKVEVFVGQGASYNSAQFKRLGYLSLDSNEKSSYQARELKTVFVDYEGEYVRLLVHRNFVNKYNHYNQVGIVAANFLGTELASAGPKLNGSPSARQREAKPSAANSLHDLSIDLNLDAPTAAKLRQLADAKSRAVSNEDYKTAKQIKHVENELRDLGAQLAQLDIAKKQAVQAEDYDRAAMLKDETDALREEIEDKIRGIHIDGVTNKPPAFKNSPRSKRETPLSGRQEHKPTFKQSSPVSIDDMVVGGGSGGGVRDYSGGGDDHGGRRVVGVEMLEEDMGDGGYPNDDDGYGHGGEDYGYDDEGPIQADTRPIRPKATNKYDDRDPEVDPDGYDAKGDDGVNFPPGQHPLEGVNNLADLPYPEEIHGTNKDTADTSGITALLGEYRTACLFSKTWALREAGMHKTRMMVQRELSSDPGVAACLAPLAAVVKHGVNDKIAQVFAAAVGVLEEIITALHRDHVPRSAVGHSLDGVISSLVEKLADGASRIRDASRQSIEAIAGCASVGPATVATHVLRALPPKQKTAWRPILGRLHLLTDMVNAHGVGGHSGLTTESVMTFAKGLNCFAHSNGEVRDAAKYLTVALFKVVGRDPLEPYLADLRKKQVEEYEAAFVNMADIGDGAVPPPHSDNKESPRSAGAEKRSNDMSKLKGSVQTSAAKSAAKDDPETATADGNPGGDNDFTICMFCGKRDQSWNEDGLDLHYWKECPLLSPCSACAQIIEIAGIPEHLLDECEQKAAFLACDTTGLAIRKDEMAAWQASPNCVAPPENCMYCPLCLASVEDTDDAWRQHLLYGCPKNARTYAT